MIKKKIWANFQRIVKVFTQKILICSQIYGSGIRDPEKTYSGSRIQGSKRHRIPDPEHWIILDEPFLHVLPPSVRPELNGGKSHVILYPSPTFLTCVFHIDLITIMIYFFFFQEWSQKPSASTWCCPSWRPPPPAAVLSRKPWWAPITSPWRILSPSLLMGTLEPWPVHGLR